MSAHYAPGRRTDLVVAVITLLIVLPGAVVRAMWVEVPRASRRWWLRLRDEADNARELVRPFMVALFWGAIAGLGMLVAVMQP